MKPEPWHEIHKLLDAVLELAPDARPAFLAKACASDPDLLKRKSNPCLPRMSMLAALS